MTSGQEALCPVLVGKMNDFIYEKFQSIKRQPPTPDRVFVHERKGTEKQLFHELLIVLGTYPELDGFQYVLRSTESQVPDLHFDYQQTAKVLYIRVNAIGADGLKLNAATSTFRTIPMSLPIGNR